MQSMVKDTHRGSVKDGGAARLLGGAQSSRCAPRVSNATNKRGSLILRLDELRLITNNFSDDKLLGKGAFGMVYKGVRANGDMIAVKRFASTITGLRDVQYENEAQHLMRLKHPNIVQLVGYCSRMEPELIRINGRAFHAEKLERLLCLEYMPKGSLRDHLSDETSGLEWNTRYKIIEGICYGLRYLHEEWELTPIIHMDLKPANILLDDNMVPKIADFGLSRLFGEEQTRTCTTSCKGTLGYMAPEYLGKGVITKKYDIFSLGVIIIQIITGLNNYPLLDETETTSQQYIDSVLKNWRHRLTKAQGYTSQDIDYHQIKKCIQIGLLCVKSDPVKRPTINQIIKMLERSDEAYQSEREQWKIIKQGGVEAQLDLHKPPSPICAMPVFDMIKTVLVKKLRFLPGLALRLIARSTYVALKMFVAITIFFFVGQLGTYFFGGFDFAPKNHFTRCLCLLLSIIYLATYNCKPKRFSLYWFYLWICIMLGVLQIVLAPIGGLQSIIISAKT